MLEEAKRLVPDEVNFVNETIDIGKKLIEVYRNLKVIPIGGKSPNPHGYSVPTETIYYTISYLEKLLAEKEVADEPA
jgi:hypothetical protein